MKRILFVSFVIWGLVTFVGMAGFITWIFWQIFHHKELVLYEYIQWINNLELGLAIAVLIISIVLLGLMLGFFGTWLNMSDKRRSK